MYCENLIDNSIVITDFVIDLIDINANRISFFVMVIFSEERCWLDV